LIFRLLVYHFEFRALETVYFPPDKAGNVLRGALETHLTRARLPGGPSGLADPPRPYVFRAAHLQGKRFEPGEAFSLDVHSFALREPLREIFVRAFSEWEHAGLGPRRGRVELTAAGKGETEDLNLTTGPAVSHCTIVFRTPTDLKGVPAGQSMPFGTLFARVRDRIGTLRNLYGEGPLEIDYKAMSRRAGPVRTVRCDLEYHDITRRSSKTGDVHGIGGFTGMAEYEGELAEFLPWLRAAWWTGVGRHTVWGNGVIEVV
jgi:hypothetical protein